MVQAPLPMVPGEILAGKYRLESVLGRGGMGVVLGATHIRLEQRVAIKFLLEGRGLDPEMRERFAREARAASKIRSEHVARVLDVGVMDSGLPYTVMEYLDGEDLAVTLHRRCALPVAESVGYVLQACEALAEAHMAGIVHRDLKPANVFLARRADGSVAVKLLDFGISKVSVRGADGGGITTGATILGSPRYMPPEQIRSSRDVDVRGDLWSLGATLFELLAGRPAFRAETLPELYVRILEEPAPDLQRLVPDAPPGLSDALRRCLAKQPAARFADVAELAAALEPFGPPECRVSVQRIARIMSGTSGSYSIAAAAPGLEVQALQDASTMKAGHALEATVRLEPAHSALGDETARSVVSPPGEPRNRKERTLGASLAVGATVALLGLTTAGVVALRMNAIAAAGPVPSAAPQAAAPQAAAPQAASHTDPPASLVVPAPSFDPADAPRPASSLGPGPLHSSAASPVGAGASARKTPRPIVASPERAPSWAPETLPPSSAPPSSPPSSPLPGTEGFGGRK